MTVLRNSFLTLIPKFIFQQNLRPKSGVKCPSPFGYFCIILRLLVLTLSMPFCFFFFFLSTTFPVGNGDGPSVGF